MKTIHPQRGQALVVIALALVGLAGMAGLVVDGGNVFLDRKNAQNAADSAALSAAFHRIRGGQDIVSAAFEAAAQNGYDSNGTTNVVEVYSPPKTGAHAGDVDYIEVTITSHVTTYFARVIGRDRITNVVTAMARTKTADNIQLMDGAAVISLAPESDCNNQKAFWVHGDATLDITGGGIFVNSSHETCALAQSGNGSIRVGNGFAIEVVGGASIQKPPLITPGVAVGAYPVGYPPPFFLPDLTCGEEAKVNEDGISMSPGSWDAEFPPNGVTQLEPGEYCLNDGLNIKGNIEGQNVVFIVNNGEVRFDGNSQIILSAPNTGDDAGLLIFMPVANSSQVTLNGGPGSSIQGTILAPGAPILLKGMNFESGFHSQIIGYTIEVDGSSRIKIIYSDAENLHSLTMPEVQLAE
jgi:Flp pilus assembly protein TadG